MGVIYLYENFPQFSLFSLLIVASFPSSFLGDQSPGFFGSHSKTLNGFVSPMVTVNKGEKVHCPLSLSRAPQLIAIYFTILSGEDQCQLYTPPSTRRCWLFPRWPVATPVWVDIQGCCTTIHSIYSIIAIFWNKSSPPLPLREIGISSLIRA